MAPADREETKEARSNPVLHIFIIHNCMPAREYHECSFTKRMLRTCCVTVLFGAYPLCSKFIFSAPRKQQQQHRWAVGIFVFFCASRFVLYIRCSCLFCGCCFSVSLFFLPGRASVRGRWRYTRFLYRKRSQPFHTGARVIGRDKGESDRGTERERERERERE